MKIDIPDGFDESNPKFMSSDLLEAAYYEESQIKAKKLAKQALEIWPDNIDAECFLLDFEKDKIKKLKKCNEIVNKATDLLKKENCFEEYKGDFWLVLETRPYMRVRAVKEALLEELGRYKEAIKECEDLLELCENDNLGIRYRLVKLYTVLEEFEKCEKIYKKYNENTANMLFVLSVIYYKKGDYTKSKKLIKELDKVNHNIYEVLLDDSKIVDYSEYIQYGSIQEASNIITNNFDLLMTVSSFSEYFISVLNK